MGGVFLKLLDLNFTIADFKGSPAVGLERNEARQRDLGILLGIITGQNLIDPKTDSRSFGANAIIIPPFLDRRSGLLAHPISDDLAPTRFVVKLPPPSRSDISLVSNHLVMILDSFAPNLNSGIRILPGDFDLKGELEIAIALGRGNEGIVGNLFFQ